MYSLGESRSRRTTGSSAVAGARCQHYFIMKSTSVRELELARALFEFPSLQLVYNPIIGETKLKTERGHSCHIQDLITFQMNQLYVANSVC